MTTVPAPPLTKKARTQKFTYDGTKQARRVLPGVMIGFEYKGKGHKDVVESVLIMSENRLVFQTVSGFRVPTTWSQRFDTWAKED